MSSTLDDRIFVIIFRELFILRANTLKQCLTLSRKPADSQAGFERSMGALKTLIKTKERRQKDE